MIIFKDYFQKQIVLSWWYFEIVFETSSWNAFGKSLNISLWIHYLLFWKKSKVNCYHCRKSWMEYFIWRALTNSVILYCQREFIKRKSQCSDLLYIYIYTLRDRVLQPSLPGRNSITLPTPHVNPASSSPGGRGTSFRPGKLTLGGTKRRVLLWKSSKCLKSFESLSCLLFTFWKAKVKNILPKLK